MASPQTQDAQAQKRQAELDVAVGAGAAAGGVAGGSAAATPAVGAAAGIAVPIAGLVGFLAEQRQRSRRFLKRQLAAEAKGRVSPDEIERLILEEELRDHLFAERQAERVTRDLTTALAIPDRQARLERVQAILRRELRYAQLRSEAMAARSFAAIDRVLLRQASPQGAFWKLGEAKDHTAGCVVDGTLVAGPKATRGFRREYAGKLVEIVVAAGDVLRITPNHPVLTPRGWIPAGVLVEGDEVLRDGAHLKRQGRGVEDPRDMRSIKEVFEAIEQLPSAARGARRMERFDFHGDFTDAEIDVVAADGRLLDHICAKVPQRIREPLLVRGDPSPTTCAPRRGALGPILRERNPAEGFAAGPDLLDIASPLFRGHCGDRESNRLAVASADLHASVEQHALESFARNGKLIGEPLEGMAGVVTRDHVIEVRHFDWAGHVFNLSTTGGWYTGNGLILQNCLAMHGKFWPWAVLNRVHPPRHPGCASSLHSYGEAIREGWLRPQDVMNVRDAIRAAAHVVMEHDERAAEALAREVELLELREVLIEKGMTTAERFDAAVAI